MSQYLAATDITADSDHAGVRTFAGFSVREAAVTAAAATVRFRQTDGAGGATGQILAELELAADASETVTFDIPVSAPDGVHVEVVAGTVEGVLYEAV